MLYEGKNKSRFEKNWESKPKKNLAGERFYRWTVVEWVPKSGSRKCGGWLCRCDCGTERIVRGSALNDYGGKYGSRSCGCVQKERAKETIYNRNRTTPIGAIESRIYRSYKNNAKNRGLCFDVDKGRFLEMMHMPCHYCGSIETNSILGYNSQELLRYNGIDRFDNLIGYTVENSVPCCKYCNRAKFTFPVCEFIEWAKKVSKHNEKFDAHSFLYAKAQAASCRSASTS